jgi:hypothetical protein
MIKFCSLLIIALLMLSVPAFAQIPTGGGDVSTSHCGTIAYLYRPEQANPKQRV